MMRGRLCYLQLLTSNLILQQLGELPFLAALDDFQPLFLLFYNVCRIKALDLASRVRSATSLISQMRTLPAL